LFSFFPAHAEAGKKMILNHFFRSLSPPTCPQNPDTSHPLYPPPLIQPIPCHYYGRNRGAMLANGRPPYSAEVRQPRSPLHHDGTE